MLQKIANSKFGKWFTALSVASMVAVMGCFTCFAAEDNISSSLTSAFSSIKGDIFTYIGIALPIALAIVGAFIGIRAAIKFFKKTAGN